MVEGGGLEIRCSVLRYRGFESLSLRYRHYPLPVELVIILIWRDVRVVEGVRLESVCAQKVPGVRIPLSPFSVGRFCTMNDYPTPSGSEGSSGK